jgi:hypothetical protein
MPLQLKNVLQDKGGIAYDLQQLAEPTEDKVLCFDFGTLAAKGFTLGTGLAFSGDTIVPADKIGDIEAMAATDSYFIVGNDTTFVHESPATARVSMGVEIGVDVQAWDADLDTIAGFAHTDNDGKFIVSNGTAWVLEDTTTARTSLGIGEGDSPTLTGLTIGSAILTGPSANRLEVGGRVALIHDNASYTSAEVYFNDSAPTTQGNNGDIWYEY